MAQKSEKKYPLSSSEYKIYEEVGQGVSAIVYRALCIPFNEIVAIKVLDLEKCNSNLDEIRREAQTLSLISHPNLLQAHCSFVANQNLWVVMPYMAGGSCLHIMKSVFPEGFEEVIIATILRDVLKALEYLHNHGHIHRDVKAGNILIHESGAIKLGDFGVSACMFDTGDRQRSRNTFVGTPCWMAPEVMEQLHGYDFKADIWSFGITALELAHGHAPFSKYPPMKVLLMTLQNAPPGLDYERDKRFTKSFKEMIAMCLVKDPTKRPSAERLLKHSFFKHARSNEYVARTLLDDLPPLGDRLRVLKLKEADRLAQKKMPYGEKEERSQSEYKRGISAWNFDLEDLKAEAALIKDYDELPAANKELEPRKPTKGREDSKDTLPYFQSPINVESLRVETLEKDEDHVMRVQPGPKPYFPIQCLNGLKGRFDVFEDDIQCESPTWRERTKSEFSRTQEMQIYKGNAEDYRNDERKQGFHKDSNLAPVAGRQVSSGPLVPEQFLSSYRLRTGDANRDKPQSRPQRERNFSGPLITHVASDIHSTDNFPGSPKSSAYNLEEKLRGLVVQQKGRFKITSGDVDLEAVLPSSSPQRTEGLQTLSQTTSMDQPSPIPSDNTSSVPVSTILPQLQFILQQNTMQRDQIATVMKYMSQVEAPPAYYSSSLASKPTSHDGAENYMIVYDITDMDSFDHVKNWLTEIERYTSDNVNKILVGNKCDLAEKRAVEQQMAKAFANDVGIPFLETSAKDATNVEQAFLTMAREIKKRVGGQTTSNNSQIGTVEMKGKPLQQKSNCCS